MAIKKVREIPKPNTKNKLEKPASYWRPKVHRDIEKAYNEGIEKFEFIRYDIKPEYLAQIAKEEAYEICELLIYTPARKYVRNALSKEFDAEAIPGIMTPHRFSPNRVMRIRGVTLPDGIKHIYCQIDFNYAKEYKKQLLEEMRTRTAERAEKIKSRNERNKWRVN